MRRAAVLLLPLVVLAGCTSTPIFRLKPVDTDARWLSGQQLVHRQSDSVEVVVSFERTWGGYLVFDVLVTNRSSATILVDPEAFHYTFTVTKNGRERAFDLPVAAVSPEEAITNLDRALGGEQSRYETRVGLELAGSLLSVVAELAADDSKDEHRRRCEKDDDDSDVSGLRADAAHEQTVRNLTDLRNYWASRALRITHVGPDQSVGGKLALPSAALARLTQPEGGDDADLRRPSRPRPIDVRLTLHCPTGSTTHPIEFRLERL